MVTVPVGAFVRFNDFCKSIFSTKVDDKSRRKERLIYGFQLLPSKGQNNICYLKFQPFQTFSGEKKTNSFCYILNNNLNREKKT